MLVFVDTEFSDFIQTDLISIALVPEFGSVFYAERTDFDPAYCSDFARFVVLPLLGRVEGAACSGVELTCRLRCWFEALPEAATLIFDYAGDWDLLCDALLGECYQELPANVGEKKLLTSSIISSERFQRALNRTFSQDWPPHHALADAKAIKAGYLAWLSEQNGSG